MSSENVELIRSFHPGLDVDVAALVEDDDAARRMQEAIEHAFDPGVECTMRFSGGAAVRYPGGIEGLRTAWQDCLKHWVSCHTEVEDMIDAGDRVVVIFAVQGRQSPEGPEIALKRATIWTLRDNRVVRVDFNLPLSEALAALERAK